MNLIYNLIGKMREEKIGEEEIGEEETEFVEQLRIM
jgi:hypothetical protein